MDSGGLLDRFCTWSEPLDRVLGGGIPAGSTTIIAGEPGAGKTILALQLVFLAARQGMKCLYASTLAEPSIKVLRYMQGFDFFDEALLYDRIGLMDLGSAMRSEGIASILGRLSDRVEHDEAAVVVIDSIRSLVDSARGEDRRLFLYDLSVHLATWRATTFLVGVYTREEMLVLPEFVIADGILHIGTSPQELARVRTIEVHKLRGSAPVTGVHFFEIDAAGVRFYPRVRLPEEPGDRRYARTDRVATGVPGLDDLLQGGVPRASATLVAGGSGTGKTTIALNFLLEGVRRDETSVLFTLDETPEQLRGSAAGLDWDLVSLEAEGRLAIHYASPVELSTDRFLQQAREVIERTGARRVVLDSLSSMALGAISERRHRELVYAFVKHMRAAGVTLLMTMDVSEHLGIMELGAGGLSFASDNLIFVRYLEIEGRLDRAIAVIKGRGFKHSMELRRMTLGSGGARVGAALEELHGVLTGLPTRRRAPEGAEQE